jgi:site-specific DNA recombinase
VQGLVSCSKCGYALSRTSTRSSARNIHYYRCLGSDAWRHLGGPVCDNRPVRQDLLDHVVWNEVVRLLEDPDLIQLELDRRLAAARTSDPTRLREKALQRELARTRKAIDRLLTAYQEELLSLDELRQRMPGLRQREHASQTELNSILDQISDRAIYLRLAETLSDFLTRLRSSADTSTSRNGNGWFASSSRTSRSETERSSSDTLFPCPPRRRAMMVASSPSRQR